MKRWLYMAGIFGLAGALAAHASAPAGQWIKDSRVSSQNVLAGSQAFRILPLGEAEALALVKEILGGDHGLHLTAGPYQPSRHALEAQTTRRTVLPEKIAGPDSLVLADREFYFVLEAKFKANGRQTRIMLTASPVYRAAPRAPGTDKNTVEIKVRGDASQAVGLGPILVMPAAGQSADFKLRTLPDAAERAAKLVRSFLYYLDQKMAETN